MIVQLTVEPLSFEIGRQAGQGDVHGRDVQDHHQLGDEEHPQQGEAGLRMGSACGVVWIFLCM